MHQAQSATLFSSTYIADTLSDSDVVSAIILILTTSPFPPDSHFSGWRCAQWLFFPGHSPECYLPRFDGSSAPADYFHWHDQSKSSMACHPE